jgi:hypothetical protein
MVFGCGLMADPVTASDGKTYERECIVLWMKTHNESPLTKTPFPHKFLAPNDMAREMIAEWCEQNGRPLPVAPVPEDEPAEAGGGAAMATLLQKPKVTCSAHPKEQLRFFCLGCDHAVCVICAGDSDLCKTHTTKALDTLIEELKADREEWARAQEECRHSIEQLCAAVQADADTKIQCISRQAAALQQQVHAPAPSFNTDILYQTLHWCRYELPPTSAQPPSAPLCRSGRSGRSLWPALLPLLRLQ